MPDLTLEVVALGWRGEGAARHDGQTIHVPGALPGEHVTANLKGERARITRVIQPSPDRIEPFCRHHGVCGGCQLQHWREEPYRRWKMALVGQALAARGLPATIHTLIDAHGRGRRRVSIHVRRTDGVVTAGFMLPRSHTLHDIDRCPVLVPELAHVFERARAIGAVLGNCDVAFTATDTGLDAAARAERKVVTAEHAKLAGLARSLDLARFTVNAEVIVTSSAPRVAMGAAAVAIPPMAFLQATAEGENVLAQLVSAAIGKSRRVADLFCGCGPFTFRLAEIARVESFDSDRAAIAALSLAARNTSGLKPVAATVRDLFRAPLVPNEMKDFDAVVFDPPRAGAEAQAKQLAKSSVKTIVAVSCDATSFARDADILSSGGYALVSVSAVDQFKWTSHVETVAVFRRAK